MGQKVHPIGIRLGISRDWASKWYADSKTFPMYVATDNKVRVFIKDKLKDASVSRIHIERPARKAHITIHTARPGIVIGKKGEDIEKLRTQVAKLLDMSIGDVRLNIAKPGFCCGSSIMRQELQLHTSWCGNLVEIRYYV